MTNQLNICDAIIEIPTGSNIKYEMHDDGRLHVDRITSHAYPFCYGFVEQTTSTDGDCLDVVVISKHQFLPQSVVSGRVVGMLDMEDEEGHDPKLLIIPAFEHDQDRITDVGDIPKATIDRIVTFFDAYKLRDTHRWSRVVGVQSVARAMEMLGACRERWQKKEA